MAPAKQSKMNKAITAATPIDVDFEKGLTFEQAEQRKKDGLTNKTKRHVTKTYWQIFTDNFFNFLNMILLVVAVLMMMVGLSWSHYLFLAIAIANTVIGIAQDVHARHLVDKLQVIVDPKAVVIREGKEMEIPVNEVLLSDILVFSMGDQVCADCELVSGEASIDESLLSGESLPVKKAVGETLYSGTFLTAGKCKAKVIRVGAANYAETLQAKAGEFNRPKSEIKASIGRIIAVCGVLAIILGIVYFLTWLIPQTSRGIPLNQIFDLNSKDLKVFIEGVTGSIVAMLPAGMFLLTSVSLTSGVLVLAKRRMLVQQFYSIEMLARIDVLCLAKTGTLTDGMMSLTEIVPADGHNEDEIKRWVSRILTATRDSNPTAAALRKAFGENEEGAAKAVLPFDSAVKYSAVTIEKLGTIAFGAYGFLPGKNEKLAAKMELYMAKGYRCVVVGRSKKDIIASTPPTDFEICGFLVLSDHIKEDAAKNIAWFKENGVAIRVISGDSATTVAEIARRAGVDGADKFISLEGVGLDETARYAREYNVFGRVSPEQKAVLVEAYKKMGHKVAMTGDGVNDILALKVADCSIAMASGSEAARNVSHLVSLDSDFSKLPDVVGQGRRVINNLQRTCSLFLNKTFFAIVVSIIFIISSLSGGHGYPFSTSNLIVWEVFAIGAPAFFLALQPSKERLKGGFLANILFNAGPSAVIEVLAAMLPFIIYMAWPQSYTYLDNPEGWFAIAKTMSVCCFTAMSYVVLLKISLPPNRFRMIVFGSFFAMGVTMFAVDFHLRGALFALEWDGLKAGWAIYLVCFVLGLSALYELLSVLAGKAKESVLKAVNQYQADEEDRI
ncbi:MAG: HAD-IC family P-type ATPase [Bacilli bacterium]|nr:HAD-IC family P-type ATPase [Bacilli bacterium]